VTEQHPITPPPKLRKLWAQQAQRMDPRDPVAWQEHVATQAARWGADQELEACCAWLKTKEWIYPEFSDKLRAARRPKPPSLKAGAIEVLDELDGLFELPAGHYNTILRALEQLDDSL